ncbi:protocadherin-9-like [Saccostrea cucullata]|uniref:protocadherin-9-like n=1 Tax=Saccostrea cuccullata TaxID=36930 RepID=UPI002ED5C57E
MAFMKYLWTIIICIPVTCGQVLYYTVSEESALGTLIGNIAIDANLSSDDLTREYIFLSQSNPLTSLFQLDEKTGSLSVGMRIDRESLAECKFVTECLLNLDVICRNSGSFYQKVNLKIKILDINDNSPTFPDGSVNLSVSEGSLVGTSFPIEGAVDRDSGHYSVNNYMVVPQTAPFSVQFQKNVDGSSRVRLVLNKTLDREIQPSYQFQVVAEDGGAPANVGTLLVFVTVLDINDQQPVFSQSQYNVTVDEDVAVNTTILTLTAKDDDEGLNGDVIYSLSPRQDEKILKLFQIVPTSGALQVKESLIFEPGKQYRIIVEASDRAKQPLMSQTQITVNVRDTHNNPPRIKVDLLSNTDKAQILEGASPNAPIAHVTVDDPDTGYNGNINCSIRSEKFQLQKFNVLEYKVVLFQPLDREVQSEYTITVLCQDEGTPPLNASSTFKVTVLDENDHDPVFTKPGYVVQTQEDNNIGSSLIRVSASDKDIGKNAEITYKLQPTRYNFLIDPKTGLISAQFRLDREETSLIKLYVLAIDGGSPARTGTASVVIRITDINDNKPEFQNDSFEFAIQENAPKYTSVGLLIATDKDENKKVTFSLLPQYNGGIPFEILPNGTIRTTEVLDREAIAKYQFTVVASDSGSPPLQSSAKITVDVLDMNDNDPIFMFPSDNNSTVIISYQTLPHTVIAHLDTRDIDEGLNATVTYVTRDRNYSHLFQLNSLSGRLILMRELTTTEIGKYKLSIIAQDKGTPPRTTERTMTIIVTSQQIPDGVSAPDDHKYFLIAIAISCVTIVIAVVIVLTICLIKRADRLRQKYHEQQKIEPYSEISAQRFHENTLDSLHCSGMLDKDSPEHQLYPVLHSSTMDSQISTKGITANLGQDDKIHHQLTPFTLQHVLRSSNSYRPGSQLVRKEKDSTSDRSGELTPSDSGRGGSEDDLNNSILLSHSSSIDFENTKHNSPRKELSFSTFNRPSLMLHGSSLNAKDHLQQKGTYPCNKLSPQQRNSAVVFQRQESLYSDAGSYCGHDDSTTTSGSYVLDQEDVFDGLNSSLHRGQCIV